MRQARTDYRMQRRALLRDVGTGVRDRSDVCDAHPDLLRAGRHLGDEVEEPCPLCEASTLRHVTYVFEGKGQRTPGGRAVPRASLARQAERYGDLIVYTVEVCTTCAWHHLMESFRLLADGSSRVG